MVWIEYECCRKERPKGERKGVLMKDLEYLRLVSGRMRRI